MTTLDAARRRPAQVLQLDDRHLGGLRTLIDTDPHVNAVLAGRLRAIPSLAVGRLGGATFGLCDAHGLHAAVFHGGNLLPVGGEESAWAELAGSVARQRRVCTSVVGRSEAVRAMWHVLEPTWGPPRSVRDDQPLLTIGPEGPAVQGDPDARAVRVDEIDQYLPAAISMFTEELGVSPLATVSPAAYRRRVSGLIDAGRAFAVFDAQGNVVFKADIGAVSAHTCQVQGVWVRPNLRGRGIGTAALASVLEHALTLAPSASLYVNEYNLAARRVYDRLGMRQVATLATVLF